MSILAGYTVVARLVKGLMLCGWREVRTTGGVVEPRLGYAFVARDPELNRRRMGVALE